jgi:hypothetical protein
MLEFPSKRDPLNPEQPSGYSKSLPKAKKKNSPNPQNPAAPLSAVPPSESQQPAEI